MTKLTVATRPPNPHQSEGGDHMILKKIYKLRLAAGYPNTALPLDFIKGIKALPGDAVHVLTDADRPRRLVLEFPPTGRDPIKPP